MKKILMDNYNASNESFLEYLHERNSFHVASFEQLCVCIECITKIEVEKETSSMIMFVYSQILKHMIYHFDPTDLSEISNLPSNYIEYLERLEHVVEEYFKVQE